MPRRGDPKRCPQTRSRVSPYRAGRRPRCRRRWCGCSGSWPPAWSSRPASTAAPPVCSTPPPASSPSNARVHWSNPAANGTGRGCCTHAPWVRGGSRRKMAAGAGGGSGREPGSRRTQRLGALRRSRQGRGRAGARQQLRTEFGRELRHGGGGGGWGGSARPWEPPANAVVPAHSPRQRQLHRPFPCRFSSLLMLWQCERRAGLAFRPCVTAIQATLSPGCCFSQRPGYNTPSFHLSKDFHSLILVLYCLTLRNTSLTRSEKRLMTIR